MKFTLRVVLLGVLSILALAACSSASEQGEADSSVLEQDISTPDTRPVEADDSENRRPQFLNSYADW